MVAAMALPLACNPYRLRALDSIRETQRIEMFGCRNAFGLFLLIIGIIFLLSNLNLFWWLRWDYLWPLILIAIGLTIIFQGRRR